MNNLIINLQILLIYYWRKFMEYQEWIIMDIYNDNLKPYLHIHNLHRGRCFLEKHSHPFWQLILVTDGQLHITTNFGSNILNAGDLQILPPQWEHSLNTPEGYTQLGLDILADCPERRIALLLEQYFTEPYIVSSKHFLALSMEINNLQNLNIPLSETRLLNLLDSLVISCMEIKDANPSFFKEQLASYLETNMHRTLRLSEIAEHFCISIPQLERRCRQYYNRSIIDLLQQHRIRKAQNLLSNTELPVREIGCMVGYDDPAHFSNFFRNRVGISPQQYRSTQYF